MLTGNVDDPLDPAPRQTDCCHQPSSLKAFAEELRRELVDLWLERAVLETEGTRQFYINWDAVSADE